MAYKIDTTRVKPIKCSLRAVTFLIHPYINYVIWDRPVATCLDVHHDLMLDHCFNIVRRQAVHYFVQREKEVGQQETEHRALVDRSFQFGCWGHTVKFPFAVRNNVR